ncbi:unnamed protein product [Moneuplotes crassus]|uniref:EF-hand domain-containing protein n=1 Tax=Euplotes crassus TaxID=5936 RepID=A0AAD2D611_EUPCR|nr:unnamed protein product [Moneuplotes crassus]
MSFYASLRQDIHEEEKAFCKTSPSNDLTPINNKYPLEEDQIEELQEAFGMFVGDSSDGKLSSREFKACLRALGYEITRKDVEKCFLEIGKDTSQQITLDEFFTIVTPRVKPRNSKEEIMKIFRLFDEDNTGKISFKNLRKIAKDLGEDISDAELKDLISEADRDNDGLITADDFYRVMSKDCNDPLVDFDSDSD